MANLETLELTISANAESASRGLQNLINSLSALSRGVGRSVGGLKRLNTELATLKGYGSMRIPSIASANTANGVKATTKAITQQTDAIKKQGLTISHFRDNVIWDEKKQREMNPQWFVDYDSPEGKRRIAEVARLREKRGNKEPIALDESTLEPFKNIKKEAQEAKESVPLIDRLRKGFNNFKEGSKNLGKELKSILPKFTALHRVMRIASTMMIRMGVRALFNGMKEGLSNYYQYSKNTGGAFAQVADQLSSTWATLKNQMGAAIAPALSAAIPVLNAIASAALTAFNALSQLFALLTGKGSWSKATAQVNAFDSAAKKAGGGGGGVNELLAKFDELNVIASESGGGGGAAAAAEDFANMFEEMYDFDSKIRDIANFIKETISWVKDNFDILLATAGLIGVAILGWKISQAFEGVLSTLGKWIEGGALITLGVVLDFDFGRKLGESLAGGDGLKAADIFEGIAGIIAAAIGGYVIGGGIGAAVGVGIALVATFTGITVGYKSQQNKLKWGANSLTPEQVKAYVQNQFKFDIYGEVKIVSAEVKNSRAAKANLDGAISELSRNLQKVKFTVEDPADITADAIKALDTVIANMREYTASSENLLTAYLQILPYDQSTKEGITSDIFSANAQLNEYFEKQGKLAADLYDQGMRNEWKNNEKEQILALMEHIENIYSKAEANRNEMKVKTSLKLEMDKLSISNFSQETANAIYKEQKSILEQFATEMEAAMVEQVSQLEYFATLAEEAGLMDPITGRKIADVYREKARFIADSFQDEMTKKLASSKAEMKEEWEVTLQEVYSDAYADRLAGRIGKGFQKNLGDALRKDRESAKEMIRQTLHDVTQINTISKNVTELFEITGWDLMNNKARKQFFESVYNAINEEAIPLLKEELDLNISELVYISGWRDFEEDQKVKFLEALRNSYGTKATYEFAKYCGSNLALEITKGLNSQNAEAKTSAQNMLKAIQAELDEKGIKINAAADVEVAIKAIIEYELKQTNTTKAVAAAATASTSAIASSLTGNLASQYAKKAGKATGAFGIPVGDVFIANEQGAELVGSINGKTSVANQGQIIEGIASGVERANSEQNSLLRQQNELLRGILEKENIVRFGASPALGRTVRQSLNMYSNVTGG